MFFLRRGVVSTSPNPQAGGPPLVGCLRLLIQFIHRYPPYRRPFLHPQPEDAPCRGDRDPHSWIMTILLYQTCEQCFNPTVTYTNDFYANVTCSNKNNSSFSDPCNNFYSFVVLFCDKTSTLLFDRQVHDHTVWFLFRNRVILLF